ncbi:PREDICTED: troponin I, fast skeletal muscle-like, partial [Bison bison bison]|uniref:Troponin I, fast skeletal muscle-like n=1 Tax=Bison bison bison TaxID=43346 RepID=A0A6P3GJH5_BISBB
LHLPGSMSEVQELCRQLHAKIDAAEEEKYDMEIRVQKSTKEVRAGTAPLSHLQERDLRDVGDWRKNIEEKSGMEGRKKMFETES